MSSELGSARPVIEIEHVTKVYDRNPPGFRWRSLLLLEERPRSPHLALDDLSLSVSPGEALGVIGHNGAGKSTLLKLIAGVTQPTAGIVRCHGSVGAMIELTVGFHPELTGWENLRCSARLRGIPGSDSEPVLHEIAAFAGIEDAMDAPLKKYSMGMKARLAFALATQFPVDVLVVDEVLAVGDSDFQLACMDRIRQRVDGGAALLVVSHEMRLISMMCDRTVRLDEGHIVDDGPTTDVVARYLKHQSGDSRPSDRGPITIRSYETAPQVAPWERLVVDAEIEVEREVRRPSVTIELSTPTLNADLVHILASDRLPAIHRPGRYRLRGTSAPFGMKNLDLQLTLGIADGTATSDAADAAVRMSGDGAAWSYVAIEPEWSIEPDRQPVPDDGGWTPTLRPRGEPVVRLTGVTKSFRRGRARAMVHAALPGRAGETRSQSLVAIDDLDLEVARGESVGIIGPNGAGKSTLLRLIAALTAPDSGQIDVGAQVVPMLDLGGGMHPRMTGRENANVRAQLLGMTRAEAAAAAADIERFADIGSAIDAPVHQYSTGMLTRLGFAVAIHCPGSILLIDELLAVGDAGFRQAALTAVEARRRRGDAVLFVSHEMALIEQSCGRIVRLDHGRVAADGPLTELIEPSYGSGSSVGVHDATSGIRLVEMRLRQRHIPLGGALEIEGLIVVDEGAPHARLELSYRAVPDDRQLVISQADRNERSFYLQTVEPAGGALASTGRYRFRCRVPEHPFSGSFDVVLAAIDDRDGVFLAEKRQEVLIGHMNPSGVPIPAVAFDWEVERLGA